MNRGRFTRSKPSGPTRALLLSATTALAACSTGVPGEPMARPTQVSTSTSAPATPLATVQPCDLLPDTAATQLGVTGDPVSKKLGATRYCEWRVDKDSLAASYTLTIQLYDTLGVTSVQGEDKQEVTVGPRRALRSTRGADTGCAISIGVTDTSRVDVVATGGSGSGLCAAALAAAELVEPELPQS